MPTPPVTSLPFWQSPWFVAAAWGLLLLIAAPLLVRLLAILFDPRRPSRPVPRPAPPLPAVVVVPQAPLPAARTVTITAFPRVTVSPIGDDSRQTRVASRTATEAVASTVADSGRVILAAPRHPHPHSSALVRVATDPARCAPASESGGVELDTDDPELEPLDLEPEVEAAPEEEGAASPEPAPPPATPDQDLEEPAAIVHRPVLLGVSRLGSRRIQITIRHWA